MASEAVHIRGLRELQRDLRKANREVAARVKTELREAADVTRQEAATRFASIDDKSAAGYRVAVRARGVEVEQKLRKVTGLRPDYGALQMRRALVPALSETNDDVERRLETMLERLLDGH